MLANVRLKFTLCQDGIGHFDFRAGILWGWLRQLSEEGLPALLVRFTTCRNVRVDAQLLEGSDIGFTEVAVI